jgi:hypothetical protein
MRILAAAIGTSAAVIVAAIVLVYLIDRTGVTDVGRWIMYSALVVGTPFAWAWLYLTLSGDR